MTIAAARSLVWVGVGFTVGAGTIACLPATIAIRTGGVPRRKLVTVGTCSGGGWRWRG